MSEQEKIKYHEIIKAGFTEELVDDKTYFNQFGYEYAIIQKELSKTLYLDWEKDTQLCSLKRNDKKQNIINEMPIKNLEHMIEIINFFTKNKNEFTSNFTTAC